MTLRELVKKYKKLNALVEYIREPYDGGRPFYSVRWKDGSKERTVACDNLRQVEEQLRWIRKSRRDQTGQ